ncbi:hypothetical protein EJ06DRAFT_423059 [Trichodelitschia bisporula]|uniref:Uncharacterized protein n=1 Tax=Trichodelitschia bisporula TaxID=703511 RepID=A0A6G1HWQ5_9PEZI|nr:hypothetical protein EJ06DRAFT_423059 [Trichodelitschia bisporula]
MMGVSNPSTPQRLTPQRALWASPFSDYHSDIDNLSPTAVNADTNLTTLQRTLLIRLNEIGKQILRRDPSDLKTQASLSAELEALEHTLGAPDSQSRQPADIDDSGLFIDDDVEDEKLRLRGSGDFSDIWSLKSSDGPELVSRISSIAQGLRQRYEEIKHINDVAVSRLRAATKELGKLRAENESLREHVSNEQSQMLYMKLQLKAIELQAAPHLQSTEGSPLRQDIERWKNDWGSMNERLRAGFERSVAGQSTESKSEDSEQSSADEQTAESASKPRPVRLSDTPLRGRKESWAKEPSLPEIKEEDTPVDVAPSVEGPAPEAPAPKAPTPAEIAAEIATDETEEANDSGSEVSEKTPWQYFLEELYEFAGVNNYPYDSDDE